MVDSTPAIPDPVSSSSSSSSVKVATPDLIIFNEAAVPVDALSELTFESLSAHEIINISRSDIINGQEVSYNLIGNLKEIERRFNSENIFSLPDTLNKYFRNFGIRFDTHYPRNGTGPFGERAYIVSQDSTVASRGDLVIDVVNMETNERVDIEILRSGTPLSDTIYVEES